MSSTKDVRKPSDVKGDAQAPEPAATCDPAADTRQRQPTTKVTPVGKKVGEAPGHLRAREEAFKRRHGKR